MSDRILRTASAIALLGIPLVAHADDARSVKKLKCPRDP